MLIFLSQNCILTPERKLKKKRCWQSSQNNLWKEQVISLLPFWRSAKEIRGREEGDTLDILISQYLDFQIPEVYFLSILLVSLFFILLPNRNASKYNYVNTCFYEQI